MLAYLGTEVQSVTLARTRWPEQKVCEFSVDEIGLNGSESDLHNSWETRCENGWQKAEERVDTNASESAGASVSLG